jgi:hypothetical protein
MCVCVYVCMCMCMCMCMCVCMVSSLKCWSKPAILFDQYCERNFCLYFARIGGGNSLWPGAHGSHAPAGWHRHPPPLAVARVESCPAWWPRAITSRLAASATPPLTAVAMVESSLGVGPSQLRLRRLVTGGVLHVYDPCYCGGSKRQDQDIYRL